MLQHKTWYEKGARWPNGQSLNKKHKLRNLKVVWDDFQKGKEGQEIVAKVTLNEVVLDYIPFISSVRSSNSHPDLLVIQHQPTFSDHISPQHWTFTF